MAKKEATNLKASGKAGKGTAKPYKIEKRGDGRYTITKRNGKGRINGVEKIKILLEAGLIKAKLPAEKPAEAAEGAAAPAGLGLAAAERRGDRLRLRGARAIGREHRGLRRTPPPLAIGASHLGAHRPGRGFPRRQQELEDHDGELHAGGQHHRQYRHPLEFRR